MRLFSLSALIVAIACSLPLMAWAETTGQLRAQAQSAKSDLASVQREIKTAQKKLRLTQAQRNKQLAALQKAQQQIKALEKSLAVSAKEKRQREDRMVVLRQRQAELTEDKRAQLKQLKEDVQQSYRAGHDDYFKLLLNQENPALFARQLRYFGYLQKARSERITELDGTLTELASLQIEEKEQIARLEELATKLTQEQSQLNEAKEQRSAALKILNSEIKEQDKNLKSLKRDQAALQSLMRRLERVAREQERQELQRRRNEERAAKEANKGSNKVVKPAPVEKETVWSQEPDYTSPYRGNCSLPASGGIRAQFGSARGGGLRWNGIVIAASAGSPVKAVKAGKVLYADFLRGYGKLVILDHGKGFMSLYGYNQSLQVRVGDSVSAGEVLASVGAGTADTESGLYFETRLRGRPSQPGNWCNY